MHESVHECIATTIGAALRMHVGSRCPCEWAHASARQSAKQRYFQLPRDDARLPEFLLNMDGHHVLVFGAGEGINRPPDGDWNHALDRPHHVC